MKSTKELRITESKFVSTVCPSCQKEQIIFGKASTIVSCNECGKEIAKPSGGKIKIKAKVKEVL